MLGEPDRVFQQDRSLFYVFNSTNVWFNMNNVNVMDWLSLSLELNPIGKVWGHLARKVYEN